MVIIGGYYMWLLNTIIVFTVAYLRYGPIYLRDMTIQ